MFIMEIPPVPLACLGGTEAFGCECTYYRCLLVIHINCLKIHQMQRSGIRMCSCNINIWLKHVVATCVSWDPDSCVICLVYV